MLRKIFIVIGIVFALLIASAIVLPIIFKDDIIALVKKEANNNLNATVDFGDIGLTLFQNFPDFTLTIDQVSLIGKGEFEGVVLADIESLKLSLDLMSVISGDKITINTIGLIDPTINVIVLADGTANYDIAIESEEAEPEVEEESAGFSVGLKEYYLKNANIIYDDREGGMYAKLTNLNHSGSGDFTQDDFLLKTITTADAVTYKMDGLAYLNKTKLDMTFNMNMNLPNMKFDFDENSVKLNALELNFDGWLAMPEEEGDPMDMDLTFSTKETSFKSILSLIPAIYMTDFEDVETSGNLELKGMAKGRLVGETYPAFDLTLLVSEARFKYPDLPKSAESIAIDLRIQNPGGSEDNTIIDLNKFHVELAGNPVDMVLHMKTPISDPYIDAAINMDLNMASLADVIPLEEGQSITGRVLSNIQLVGYQSALDQERYQDFKAAGELVLENFDYKDPELPYATLIEKCSLQFTPQHAVLSAFNMKLGKSDIALVGRVDNIVSWYVANEPLSGSFDFSSTSLDLNEFMTEDEETTEEAEEESSGVAEVPAGYDFVLNTSVNSLIYENLNITNVKGSVVLHDQQLNLNNLAMNLLDGSLLLSGTYGTKNPVRPNFDFNMAILDWSIQKTYEYVEMAQKIAPVMENASGAFSSSLTMAGKMDQNMDPDMNTLNGKGKLTTSKVSLNSPAVLTKAAEAIKYVGLKNMVAENLNMKFKFENGRIELEPFDFIMGKEIPTNFSGSQGFDGSLDYVMKLDIPTKLMGSAATQVVSGLLSKAGAATGLNATMPERLLVDLDIKGMTEDPQVTPRIAGTKGAGDDLKDQAMDEVNKKKEMLENQAKAEADKMKAEAQAAGDKAKADAEAAAKKAEADARAKVEAEKRKAESAAKAKEAELKAKAEAEKKKAEEEAKRKAAAEAKKKLGLPK